MKNLLEVISAIESTSPRSAWDRGVKVYALELLEELPELDDDPEPELLDPEPEELLPDEELELEELLELLDELESDSSPVGTPPSVNMITALK